MTPEETVARVVTEESVGPRKDSSAGHLALHRDDALPVARAELLYLWDDYRGEYLDWAALNAPLGHAHPSVTRAVAEHGRYYGLTAPQGEHLLRWPVRYAEDLSGRFTGRDEEEPRRVLYTEGGREAVRLAVDLATRNSGRPHLAVVGGAHSWLGQTWSYNWDFDPADALWDRLGAVLVGPVDEQARVIRPGAARRWMLAARAAGVPVVYDESVTGFGRLGTVWGQERTGLTADLTVLGGPAGGGWPLGAVVAPPGFFDGLRPDDVSPLAGHPVACCAGAASLEALSLGVLEYVAETVPILERGLDELVSQFGHHLSGHHGAGLLRGLRFADPGRAPRFALDCRAHGIYLAPPPAGAGAVVLAPPLITSTNEMARGLDSLAATLLAWDDEDAA